jgi:hypothetical protein
MIPQQQKYQEQEEVCFNLTVTDNEIAKLSARSDEIVKYLQLPADTREDCAVELTPAVRPLAPLRVAEVEALPGFQLRVRFADGSEGTVEMAEFVNSKAAGVFAALRDENAFRQARIVLGAITWPGDLDLAPDAMHRAIKEHGTWVVK